MRDYGKVSPQFWVGRTGKAIKAQGIECQLVALYLLTNPHTNMLGLYYLPTIYIAHETGLTEKGASKALRRLSEAEFCAYDDAAEFVWVYEMARYQIADSLKENDNRVSGINREYQSLPKNAFLGEFFDKYAESFHLDSRREPDSKGSPSEAPCKPLRSQEQEQEQEQEHEQEQETASRFDEFWKVWPKKKAKPDAQKAWKQMDCDQIADDLIAHVQARKSRDPEWLKEGGKYIPHAGTFLRGKRWEDEWEASDPEQETEDYWE